MQFQVPQFIEVEDKIFGPLTFKQFVFVAGGLGMCYLLWRILPIFLSAPLILGIGGLAAALAFMKYNGRPFIVALENAFFYTIRGKLYLWNNERKTAVAHKTAAAARPELYIPRLSESRLHELAWSLDIKERIASGTAAEEEKGSDSVQGIRTPQEVLAHIQARNS